MANTGISRVGTAVRLPYAVLIVLLLMAVYWVAIHPWMTNWGSSAAEQQMALPGDQLRPRDAGISTKAITIYAPPEVVWQWLVQIGQDRAGFYTYTWLENLFGADFRNANVIHPEWQHLAVGDGWRLLPVDYPLGLGKDSVDPLLLLEPGRAMIFDMFGAYIILPIDEYSSRLMVRGEASPPNLFLRMAIDPVVFTMERRMLLGLKARAEGRPDTPAVPMAIAQLGWISAGLTVTALFLSEKRRRYWLVLPVLAALPALLMSGDAQAALAAFLATGIPVLGFLVFGRSWWGPMLVIGSVVLLTLLLAPEAYMAIGFAFVLILITALGVRGHERSGALNGTTHRKATPTG
jgi:hypothetical protein